MVAESCSVHPRRKARWACRACGRGLCRSCRLPYRRFPICSEACAEILGGEGAEIRQHRTGLGRFTRNEEAASEGSGVVAAAETPAESQLADAVEASADDSTPAEVAAAPRETSLSLVTVPSSRAPGTEPGAAGPRPVPPAPTARNRSLYVLIVLQSLGIIIAAWLVFRLAATLRSVEGRLDESPATSGAEQVPSLPSPGLPAMSPTPVGSPAEAAVTALPSELGIRDGIIIRGKPVTIRGRAPYGDVVALASDGAIVATAVVEDGVFEFVDVGLTPGPHSLAVIAFSRAGPASPSRPVSIRYEEPEPSAK